LARAWDAVAWVQVDARAEGGLGATFGADVELGTVTPAELRHRLATSLAGRAAEHIVAGEADSGSASDLAAANALALRAVRGWGLSRRGPLISAEYVEAIVEAEVDAAVREQLIADSGDLRASVSGRFRHDAASDPSAYPAVGDWVAVEGATGDAVIHAVLPRRSALVRQASGKRTEAQVVGANLDVVFVVASLN